MKEVTNNLSISAVLINSVNNKKVGSNVKLLLCASNSANSVTGLGTNNGERVPGEKSA